MFSLIPALHNADFVRYGVMHRNTFLDSPRILNSDFSVKDNHSLFFAGQITGVEGYMESAASGIMAGINACRVAEGKSTITLPNDTMIGALSAYISDSSVKKFQPMGANFGVLPELENRPRDKKERGAAYSARALKSLDNYLKEIIKGCVEAVAEYNINVTLTGDETKIKNVFSENSLSMNNIGICHCTQKITMEDSAESVLKEKKDSSMAVGLRLLNEGKGDAFVSAGNSGALCVGATLAIKRIKEIKRPAFAPVMPSESGFFMLMDGGANDECRPEMLYQLPVMGSIYMDHVMGIKNPRVGLANVGAEEHKGTELYRNTHELLQNSNLNFIGNVEGRDIPNGVCDVVVCDGFTGNLILKTYEGVALVMMNQIKNMFMGCVKGKLAAGLVMMDLKNMKTHFDYNRYGGAPILGASKPVFKAHGSAKAVTVKNAIRLSVEYVKANAIEAISSSL